MKKILLTIGMVIALMGCERTSCWECQSNNDGDIYTTIFCDVTSTEIREIEADGNRTYEIDTIYRRSVTYDTIGFYWESATDQGMMAYDYWYGSYSSWQKYWTGECKFDSTVVEYIKPVERFVTMECKEQ